MATKESVKVLIGQKTKQFDLRAEEDLGFYVCLRVKRRLTSSNGDRVQPRSVFSEGG